MKKKTESPQATEQGLDADISDKLNDKQRKIIPLIISLGNIDRACHEAGIARATFYLWLKDDNFVMELRGQQETVYNRILIELHGLLGKAIDVYRDLLDCDDDSLRFKTSTAVIENTIKLTEQKELKDRLDKLEEAVEDKVRR
jgi:hypothetical protein